MLLSTCTTDLPPRIHEKKYMKFEEKLSIECFGLFNGTITQKLKFS